MDQAPIRQAMNTGDQGITRSTYDAAGTSNGLLTRLAAWVRARNLPFLVTSIGMSTMLLWAGSFKLTRPGAEGIAPWVDHSPLIWWHFKIFGPYVGSDIIGATEIAAAILLIVGHVRPKAGIIGALITTLMFAITSSMLVSTPGTTISVPGISFMRYMDLLGLFFYKDVISLGASLYLVNEFGRKAMFSKSSSV